MLFQTGPLKVEQDGMGKVHVTVGSEGSQATAEFDVKQLAELPGALLDAGCHLGTVIGTAPRSLREGDDDPELGSGDEEDDAPDSGDR